VIQEFTLGIYPENKGDTMDITAILQEEKKKLERGLEAIEEALGALNGRGRGTKPRGKRNVSAAGKKRIAQAQRARWAKWRAQNKKKAA